MSFAGLISSHIRAINLNLMIGHFCVVELNKFIAIGKCWSFLPVEIDFVDFKAVALS